MPSKLGTTVTKQIMEEQRRHPYATGDFSSMLYELVVALKVISSEVNKAGLMGVLGRAGARNIQDEEQMKLDIFSNIVIVQKMDHTGYLCGMASEEMEDILEIPDKHPQGGKYVLIFDPLDGSSNIDANVSIGTIFGIYRKVSNAPKCAIEDFLQPGHKLVAAGYAIYGSSTMLVYSTGRLVCGFTLDPSVGEFILSHPEIVTPKQGKIYSVNEGNMSYWDKKTTAMVNYFKENDKSTGRPYSSRYIGSLVADFHRNLLYGGLFMYPAYSKDPSKPAEGKLRLLYEAAPLAFIAEAAGGAATDGRQRILDIVPDKLHQRVPLYLGSKDDVETATRLLQ
ncbi:MAG: fructose-1,6-bisphosphatase class 1 [bacterium]|nr:MAG: fructose-1,6-bisphosphatase class 1 [bacterium]